MSTITDLIESTLLEKKRDNPLRDLKAAMRAMKKAADPKLRDVPDFKGSTVNADVLLIRGADPVEDSLISKAIKKAGFVDMINRRMGQEFYWELHVPGVDWAGEQRTKAAEAGSKLLRGRGWLATVDYRG